MESFRYVDIFATKGLEYLLVIGFLVALVLFWRLMRAGSDPEPAFATAGVPASHDSAWFNLDENLYYHQGHSWARPRDEQILEIGVDDFAQKLLGKPNGLQLPEVGSKLRQGENGWWMQFGDNPIAMLSPVNGEVVAVNEQVAMQPGLLNDDPYGAGWLLRVRVPAMRTELRNLLTGRVALAWMGETMRKLRYRLSGGSLGMVLQDGGLPVSGFVAQHSPEGWQEIAQEFLMTDD